MGNNTNNNQKIEDNNKIVLKDRIKYENDI